MIRALKEIALGFILLSLGALGSAAARADDYQFKVIHTLQGSPDAAEAWFGGHMILDNQGNLYGTTRYGGTNASADSGAVFKVTPKGKLTVLYSFCPQGNCADGENPFMGVAFDQSGNLYGTTAGGGAHNWGTVFRLASDGTHTVLYNFCTQANCTDGGEPWAPPVVDGDGNLYGTTLSGGTNNEGVIFKVSPGGAETVLHNFCSLPDCADGERPFAGLVSDKQGNLYGTAPAGGKHRSSGVLFRLRRNGAYRVLHQFGSQPLDADGVFPEGLLMIDGQGNLYGTTERGGTGDCHLDVYHSRRRCGAVFKFAPDGTETVLYSFCPQPSCTDGKYPLAGVVADNNGNLFGTTSDGGSNGFYGDGTVFEVAADGTETVLHVFCSESNCNDGAYPLSGLAIDEGGNLFGATVGGGSTGYGVIFELEKNKKTAVVPAVHQ